MVATLAKIADYGLTNDFTNTSACMTKAQLLQLKLLHIFARAILSMKKLEIEKTNPTFIISVFKVEY